MWKKITILAAVAAATTLATVGLRQADAISVDVLRPARGELVATLDLTAKVINDHTVTITALLDGEIVSIRAREGATVKAGDTLAQLDDRQAKAVLNKAIAEVAYQGQHLDSAGRTYQRNRNLSKQNSVSQQTLEDSLVALHSAEAALKVAQSAVRIGELQLGNATIRAPFDGIVTERDAETGQWVEAGTRLFTLVASDGHVVEAQVDAGDAGRVSLGQPVTLSSAAWPGVRWKTEIDWIAPAVTRTTDSSANAFAVRMPLGGNAPALLLGQQLDVELEIARRENVLHLPLRVMQESTPGHYSVLVVRDGVAARQALETGLLTIDNAEITGGLSDNDTVIVPGRTALEAGSAVSVR